MLLSLATSLLFFGLSVYAKGSAYVVNNCPYEVYLCNTPSEGGGYEEYNQTLASGQSWSQEWTELQNNNGWSIKLSQTDQIQNILQYEYTFHNDGIIWYDLSCVDGNPWSGDWKITASPDTCKPRQAAYRYSTDDAYGMQSCSDDAAITVTLCSSSGSGSGTTSTTSSTSTTSQAEETPDYSSDDPSADATPDHGDGAHYRPRRHRPHHPRV